MADSSRLPRFHHYVPRFYLCGWSTSVGCLKKRVWTYKKNQEPRHSAIKRTGGRPGMYEARNIPGVYDAEKTEKDLGKLEAAIGKILPKILAKRRLSVRDYSRFCYFLSIFFRRSPYTKDQFGPAVMGPVLSDQGRVQRKQVDRIEDAAIRGRLIKTINEVEHIISSDFASVYSVALFMEADEVARAICENLTGAFFYTTRRRFITSDNPVTFDRRSGISHPERGYVLFPISPSVAFLAGRFLPHSLTYTEIPDRTVDYLNDLIISNAYEEVYSDYRSSELRTKVDQGIGSNLAKFSDKAVGNGRT